MRTFSDVRTSEPSAVHSYPQTGHFWKFIGATPAPVCNAYGLMSRWHFGHTVSAVLIVRGVSKPSAEIPPLARKILFTRSLAHLQPRKA